MNTKIKPTLAIVLASLLFGCDEETRKPISVNTKPNGYEVARLFTQDGVTVYRFYDEGEYLYFATSGRVEWSVTRDAGTGDGQTITDHREVPTVEIPQEH